MFSKNSFEKSVRLESTVFHFDFIQCPFASIRKRSNSPSFSWFKAMHKTIAPSPTTWTKIDNATTKSWMGARSKYPKYWYDEVWNNIDNVPRKPTLGSEKKYVYFLTSDFQHGSNLLGLSFSNSIILMHSTRLRQACKAACKVKYCQCHRKSCPGQYRTPKLQGMKGESRFAPKKNRLPSNTTFQLQTELQIKACKSASWPENDCNKAQRARNERRHTAIQSQRLQIACCLRPWFFQA